MTRQARPSVHAEDGVAAVPFIGAIIILMLMLMAILYTARIPATTNILQGAAREAARHGTQTQTFNMAHAAATDRIRRNIEEGGVHCTSMPNVTVRSEPAVSGTSRLPRGGYLVVEVTCNLHTADLVFAGPGNNAQRGFGMGTTTLHAYARERVDLYRGH